MSGWLKFLGFVTLISGIPAALTIVGLVVAWVPIWLGMLLIQAGTAAQRESDYDLLRLVEKLKTYVIVQGVMLIIVLVTMIIIFALFGAVFFEMIREAAQNSQLLEA
jgi:threonine/homoserine/homoserine lactone efflux protein